MVNKLIKHETRFYLRTLLPMYAVLLGVAVLGRFVQLFDNDTTAYNIIFTSSIVAFVVACVVCFLLTLIFGIKRFYSNLFSCEGYLTFTLPVTSSQHLFVKVLTATLSMISSLIMIIISVCFITFGEVCIELFKAAGYLVKQLYIYSGALHATAFIAELIVSVILAFAMSYLLFYACISIGQTAKKNRIAAAVGVYFGYYLIEQVLGTVIIVLVNEYYEQWHLDKLMEYLSKHDILATHLFFGVIIILSGLLGLLFYAISKKVITKKLNLE